MACFRRSVCCCYVCITGLPLTLKQLKLMHKPFQYNYLCLNGSLGPRPAQSKACVVPRVSQPEAGTACSHAKFNADNYVDNLSLFRETSCPQPRWKTGGQPAENRAIFSTVLHSTACAQGQVAAQMWTAVDKKQTSTQGCPVRKRPVRRCLDRFSTVSTRPTDTTTCFITNLLVSCHPHCPNLRLGEL